MVAEMRTTGERLTIYTDDNQVYRRFRQGLRPFSEIRYFQQDRLVGIDLYFDRKQRRSVMRIMKGQLVLTLKKVGTK